MAKNAEFSRVGEVMADAPAFAGEAPEAKKKKGSPRTLFLEAGPLIGLFEQVEQQIIQLQDEFEELLLNQAEWTSVDLLEHIGLKHHELYTRLRQDIQVETEDVEIVKQNIRARRTALFDWLFQEFNGVLEEPGVRTEERQAFKGLLDGFTRLAMTMPKHLVVPLEEVHFTTAKEDTLASKSIKVIKRLSRRLFSLRFERQLKLRALVEGYLLGKMGRRLLIIADKVGEAQFLLSQRVKGLYEELDQAYNGFLMVLDNVGSPFTELAERDRITAEIDKINGDVEEVFQLVANEIMEYYRDVRGGFEKEIEQCLDGLAIALLNAGTFGVSGKEYHGAGRPERSLKRIEAKLSYWQHYQAGYVGKYMMEIEVGRLQYKLRYAVDETVLQVNERIGRQLKEHMEAVEEHLRETFEFLRSGWQGIESQEEVRAKIEMESSKLATYLRHKVAKRLEAIRNSAEINQLIDLVRARCIRLTDETSAYFPVVEHGESTMNPTFIVEKAEQKEAPLRAVVRVYLEHQLIPRLGDINEAMIDQIRRAETWIDELWDIISFSLGNVAIELREAGKTPDELIPVSLNRMENSLQGLRRHYEEILQNSDETRSLVIKEVANTARLLKQLVIKGSVTEMQRQIATGEKKNMHPRDESALEESLGGLAVSDTSELKQEDQIKDGITAEPDMQHQGKKTVWESKIWDREDDLIERVPFAYRQLFRTSPLEVSEFLTGRSEALEAIERACKRWRQGEFSSVVLIGAQGSGKTSLINCAMEQRLKGIPLRRHRLSRDIGHEAALVHLLGDLLGLVGDSLEHLGRLIQQTHTRRIIILEDLHCIYMRSFGGIDLLKKFLGFIDLSGDHILWLTSIDQYAWQYLDRIHDTSRYFAFRLETGSLSPKELEGAIMARHRVTGYQLRFIETEASSSDDPEILRENFFRQLGEACGGNVFAAIFYWLRAIERVEENTLVIASIAEPHLEVLQELSSRDMLELAMIIEHGGLDVELYARVFQKNNTVALSELNRLFHLGLLQKTETKDTSSFEINPILYHPITMALKERGIFL